MIDKNLHLSVPMKPASITADSTPDIVLDWLHDNGWSIQHKFENGYWSVQCSKADQLIRTRGLTLEEAWLHAVECAESQEIVAR